MTCLVLAASPWAAVSAEPQSATRVAQAPATPARPTAAPGAAQSSQALFDRDSLTPEYRVAPGDLLQVFVWKEPELTREVRVRTDGFLTVPLLGDVFAVGKTPRGLSAELAQQLAQFLNSPVVTVTLRDSAPQRFYVVGEVGKPGEFPLIGRTTVMQALALAGGFREYAKSEEVKILRQELTVSGGRVRTQEVALPVNYKSLAQGQNLQNDLLLKPGDVIVVP